MAKYTLTRYLLQNQAADVTYKDYEACPARAFLIQIVHLWDAIAYCKRHFPKNQDGHYKSDGNDSLNRLSCATLSAIMGHFETYQRALFAGLFELTSTIPSYDIERCNKQLRKNSNVELTIDTLSRYRCSKIAAGNILADNLSGWHNPDKVNDYMNAICGKRQFFSAAHRKTLLLLWQLRHSIVHTGGWLTSPDAQKNPELADCADKPIIVKHTFVDNVVRRLHVIVKKSTDNMQTGIKAEFPGLPGPITSSLDDLCHVCSPRQAWLTAS